MQKKSHTPFFSPPADEKKAHCGPITRHEGDSKSWTKTKNARGEKKNPRGEKKNPHGEKIFVRGETIFTHEKTNETRANDNGAREHGVFCCQKGN